MAKTAKESRGFWEDMPKRSVLAHMEFLKAVSEAFTKSIDTYIEAHNASEEEEENRWLRDFPKNASKAGEEMLKSLSKAHQRALDKYFEEEDEESASVASEG